VSISLLTNLNALTALENLRTNGEFQSRTIQRLSSGYRISRAGDDPAGVATANRFRQDAAELTQGVSNANNGISSLQIIDGGMSNISQILDRLKTLATQSASAIFTGDRNMLNSEFQTLLGEISRQAQSIGLDSGGQFAKPLPIYIGGSASDSSVTVDLSSSSVDSPSLGLGTPGAIGMQVMGAPGYSVAQILADPKNTTATPGYTDFYIAGPGFSDAGKINVPAKLQGVSDLNSLVASINTAIQAAANGSAPGATAFANSGITASVNTDANGGQELSFGSTTTAFQVEAGDQMANALLGHLTVVNGVLGSTGTPLATTVSGVAPAAGFTVALVTVRFTGAGLAAPVDITLDPGSSTANLQTQVSSNAQLAGAGISAAVALDGSLIFTGSHGEKFSVQSTGEIGRASCRERV
jgi:flagellin